VKKATPPLRAFLLLVVVPLLGCSALGLDPAAANESELQRAQRLWSLQEMDSYRYTYGSSCGMCVAIGPAVVEVRDGTVTSARNVGESDPLPMTEAAAIPTVPDLFALIARALAEEADALEVTYHPALGYPVTVAVDWHFGLADDEVWHSVESLVRLASATPD
jgi:hypothetical protein